MAASRESDHHEHELPGVCGNPARHEHELAFFSVAHGKNAGMSISWQGPPHERELAVFCGPPRPSKKGSILSISWHGLCGSPARNASASLVDNRKRA